jgi:hypothetical protein
VPAPSARKTVKAEDPEAPILRQVAIEAKAVSDTIDYLEGILAVKRAQLRGALEKRSLRSSETLIRGLRMQLRPFEIVVCACHSIGPGSCPTAATGAAIALQVVTNGDYLQLSFDETFPRAVVPRFDSDESEAA